MKYKVAIARFPGDGWECKQSVSWLIKTVREMDKDERISAVVGAPDWSDTPITMVRNRVVKWCQQNAVDYLLMIDSDMAPDIKPTAPGFWKTAWDFMMERRKKEREWRASDGIDKPIGFDRKKYQEEANELFSPATICAPYCGPAPWEYVYIFHWANYESDTPNIHYRLEMIPREMSVLMRGIQMAAAMPTGLILYDLRVFNHLPYPYFEYEYEGLEKTEKVTTEDVYQTRNASLVGCPQFVAWDCWSGHVKLKVVGPPTVVTRDQVHDSLARAVLLNASRNDSFLILPGTNGGSNGNTVADDHLGGGAEERGDSGRRGEPEVAPVPGD